MKVLYVIPISRGIAKEELSYFSSGDISLGSLLYVPLRGKEVPAIVIASEDPRNIKAQLRTADFKLKKLSSKKGRRILSSYFIEAARKMAYENASTTGAVLHSLVPRAILEEPMQIAETFPKMENGEKTPHSKIVNEKYILQNTFENRVEEYKNIIRNSFARGGSVLLCASTIKEANRLYKTLKKGIKDFSFVLHSGYTKKQQRQMWNEAISRERPVFAVVTGGFVSLPLFNLSTIIVENENSPFYTMNERPHLDIRQAVEKVASFYDARLIFGGFPLRVSTFYRYKEDELEPLDSPLLRLKEKPDCRIIDMRKSKEEAPSSKNKFRVLGDELISSIDNTIGQKKRVFLFALRRGLSPVTVCQDCGATVTCEYCGASVVLHKARKEEYNKFICHACGASRSALEKCHHCDSWKLKDLGIGIQKTEEALKEQFPDTKILRLDRETGNTYKKAQKIADDFYSSTPSVLVGTEMSLSYLDYEVSFSGIASLDSLLSLPEFRAQERVFSMLIKIYERTDEELIVQTRTPENELLKAASGANFSELYEAEMQMREQLNYPPFSKLVKVICTAPASKLEPQVNKVMKELSDYDPKRYEPVSSVTGKGQKKTNLMIKISSEKWPDEDLLSILKNLPMNCSINVDPENLLN